ncbi:MAG: hypothetical protein Q9162_004293 [Coniocarpon cinnabarinum]
MRSYLTRSVFRRLLCNQDPVIHRRSLHTARLRPQWPHHGRALILRPQQRTLLGLFDEKPQQRDLREPLLDPGMSKMLQLDKRIHLIARYPPTEDLVAAFNAFMGAKKKQKMPMEDFHATQVLQTLRVIEGDCEKREKQLLRVQDYFNAMMVISSTPTEKLSPVHNELIWLVYERWLAATSHLKAPMNVEEDHARRAQHSDFVNRMVSFLCRTMQTARAEELLDNLGNQDQRKDSYLSDLANRLWPRLLDGYAKEDNESDMLRILERLEAKGAGNSANVYASLLMFYARRNNIDQTKRWATPKAVELATTAQGLTWYTNAEVRKELFSFCLRTKQMAWAQSILQTRDGDLDQEAMFLGALSSGKSIDELDRMFAVFAQRSSAPDPLKDWHPSLAAVNSLLDHAISVADPYTAERIFALAQRYHTPFDAQTYIHQIRYRLLASDLPGALSSYALLRDQPITNNQDWDVMNLLTQHLAADSKIPHDTIMGLVADLSDRQTLFPAATVAPLCAYHLRRDEYFELVDLLQTYAYQYSTADRIMLRDLLLSTCLDPASDTARVWDTYMIFHQVFDLETAREPRQHLMNQMFQRRRPDLATHVFTRMARHSRANTRPDHSTYVDAFIGIAHNAEPEALEVLHNMLKLDTDVEPSTQLRNSLMLAYSACGAHWRALEFWEEVAASAEGPSYESLYAAFWACERTSWGYKSAHRIWERLVKGDVEINVELAGAYLGALSANGLTGECWQVLRNLPGVLAGKSGEIDGRDVDGRAADNGRMEHGMARNWIANSEGGRSESAEGSGKEQDDTLAKEMQTLSDAEMEHCIACVFNAARGVVQQQEIEDWVLSEHPSIWQALEKRGIEEDEMGVRRILGFERRMVA